MIEAAVVLAIAIGISGWVVGRAIEQGTKAICGRIGVANELLERLGDKVDHLAERVGK